MYDFLETNSLYIVMLIVLIIWVGIFGYLKSIDNKIKKIENSDK
ncbi:MAG TPA: CcmD family protein [Ignavibacteria bacterium]|nr:CcmD family protein [Bacteroidota bacterium]HRI84729.1 CcmD family protein [Ignavibacteria bacterium]HRK00513.1 CcmD family protein [Ignavibacteria bacterium]